MATYRMNKGIYSSLVKMMIPAKLEFFFFICLQCVSKNRWGFHQQELGIDQGIWDNQTRQWETPLVIGKIIAIHAQTWWILIANLSYQKMTIKRGGQPLASLVTAMSCALSFSTARDVARRTILADFLSMLRVVVSFPSGSGQTLSLPELSKVGDLKKFWPKDLSDRVSWNSWLWKDMYWPTLRNHCKMQGCKTEST